MKKCKSLSIIVATLLLSCMAFASALTFHDDFGNYNYTSEGWITAPYNTYPIKEDGIQLSSDADYDGSSAIQNFADFDFGTHILLTFAIGASPDSQTVIYMRDNDIMNPASAAIAFYGDLNRRFDDMQIACGGGCSCPTVINYSAGEEGGFSFVATINISSGEVTLLRNDGQFLSTFVTGCDLTQLSAFEILFSDAFCGIDDFSITDTCTPDWSCTGYAACVNGSQACNAVTDLNTCGEVYAGDYSEFTPQVCSTSPFTYTGDDVAPAVLNGIAKAIITIGAFATVIVLVGLASYFGVLRWFK